jgi:predicted signal transduction protein with EAL and GGDEF domain
LSPSPSQRSPSFPRSSSLVVDGVFDLVVLGLVLVLAVCALRVVFLWRVRRVVVSRVV